jgi:hypothetical protein
MLRDSERLNDQLCEIYLSDDVERSLLSTLDGWTCEEERESTVKQLGLDAFLVMKCLRTMIYERRRKLVQKAAKKRAAKAAKVGQ